MASSHRALQKHRTATVLGSGGLGVAAILAGAVLVVAGGSAGATTTCAATQPSQSASATDSPVADATDTPTDQPTDDPSATATATATGTPTDSGNPLDPIVSQLPFPLGGGQGTTTATPTDTASATDSPTDEPSATPPPVATSISASPRRITRGEKAKVVVHGAPGCLATLYAATRPSTTYKVAHTAVTGPNGYATFSIAPVSNTLLYATTEGGTASPKTSVNVRYRISLQVTRVATNTMRFQGGVTPGGGGTVVDVWRSGSNGNVKVGTTRTASNGGWSLQKQLPRGTYTFFALVATTANNDGNRSPYTQATVN